MRIKVDFETENPELPIEYRRKFLSYLKNCIKTYDSDIFDMLYDGSTKKSFCSSIYFSPEVIINKNNIELKSKRFSVQFSTVDISIGIHLLNAFMARKNQWGPLSDYANKIKVVSICKIKEKDVDCDYIEARILSPIIVRNHSKETGKDWYLVYSDQEFEEILKRNLKTELSVIFDRNITYDVDALKFTPISLKKTVVKNYGIYIPCTIGRFALEGERYLLEYIYKAGIGSKKSMGFGCIDLY